MRLLQQLPIVAPSQAFYMEMSSGFGIYLHKYTSFHQLLTLWDHLTDVVVAVGHSWVNAPSEELVELWVSPGPLQAFPQSGKTNTFLVTLSVGVYQLTTGGLIHKIQTLGRVCLGWKNSDMACRLWVDLEVNPGRRFQKV